jgi:dolichol-phosphate mannosyltransferase
MDRSPHRDVDRGGGREAVTASVILPTYNERETIIGLVQEILAVLGDAGVIAEVVVDDDSPDRTWDLVEQTLADDQRVRVLRRVGRRGLPGALAEGLALAAGDALIWLDADGSMPANVIPSLVAGLENADVAVASRYAPGGKDARDSRLRIATSWLINALATAVLARQVRDYTSGFVAIKRGVLQKISIRTDYTYGDYCIDFLYRACRAGLGVREIPFRNVERLAGQTKTAPDFRRFATLGMAYLATIIKLRFRSR